MEKNITSPREQPISLPATSTEVENVKESVEENVQQQQCGSLGKFKDAESLLNAYNNLQAEFTKKCQSLSEIKSKIENTQEKKESVPIYEKENWVEKVTSFLCENKDAKPFAKEIAQNIIADEELASKENALELAWAKVASSKYVAPERAVEDDAFVNNYILKSEKIKSAVLDMMLKEMAKNNPPKVIASEQKGSSAPFSKQKQATSLSEAKEMVKQMFN